MWIKLILYRILGCYVGHWVKQSERKLKKGCSTDQKCWQQLHREDLVAVASEQKTVASKQEKWHIKIWIQFDVFSQRQADWVLDIKEHCEFWERTDTWLLLTLKYILMTLTNIQLNQLLNQHLESSGKEDSWINQCPNNFVPGRTVLKNEGGRYILVIPSKNRHISSDRDVRRKC